ncbi:hypothetical protein CPLU01_12525 [Colletotrichum plurivorum]|uniref:Uncharacterized protein n=1 Tax=Colletotrichum plurivorum TaxID=2175906 RepID=A0A8H6JYZ8_9PEZI|nr:hypothetical protein CPLU01_12525 [Colletotrichum plurivorum]
MWAWLMDLEMLYAGRSNQGRDNEMDGTGDERRHGRQAAGDTMQDNETRAKWAKARGRNKPREDVSGAASAFFYPLWRVSVGPVDNENAESHRTKKATLKCSEAGFKADGSRRKKRRERSLRKVERLARSEEEVEGEKREGKRRRWRGSWGVDMEMWWCSGQ